jgi:hypothetical protein
MSEGAAPGAGSPSTTIRRRWLPFWLLQVVELVVALVYVDISVHVGNGGLLVGAAVALAVLSVTARGPLGVVRVCAPPLHVVLLVVVAGGVAVAPIVPALRPDVEGIIVIVFGSAGLIRLATLTRTTPLPRRGTGGGPGSGEVIDATAAVAEPDHPRGANSGPGPSPWSGAAARWAGRTAGAATASGKRAVDKHRPDAEARVKRSIRGAGRVAGRWSAPLDGPGDSDR